MKPSKESIRAFLEEVAEVSKKHGLSISHEDPQGGFLVGEYEEYNIKWLLAAVAAPEPRFTPTATPKEGELQRRPLKFTDIL